MPTFTIFTPIYNRKHTIHRVWESLLNQTNSDFEWLIVNDGSNDGIEPLLEKYKNEADFSVRIFNQKNSGKHIAFNKAIDEAKGELLVPADSDDRFIPTTLEIFNKYWKIYNNENLSGISVLCMDEKNRIIGDKFPQHEMSSNYLEVVYKYKIKGEKWGCIRVDLLKKFKFPELEGAKFFPESYVWSQIGMNYKTLYLNIPIRIYYQDAGNQIMKTKNKSLGTLKVENYYAIWWINSIMPKVNSYISFKNKIIRYVSIWKSTFQINKSPLLVLKELKRTKDKIFELFLLIPSFLFLKLFKYKR